MSLSNEKLDNLFEGIKVEGEENFYYFYNTVMSTNTHNSILGTGLNLKSKTSPQIVCFTEKRIIIFNIDPITGEIDGNKVEVDIEDNVRVVLTRGIMSSTVIVETLHSRGKVVFKPANYMVGLSNHKTSLIKLYHLYRKENSSLLA
ncbi:hypothetical protein COF68_05605 [Bacillus toyonensis]|uniref:hypothetical protein n=1 Tax=Bacillus toyonensis TaxID=155322 RepID=UPI000BFEA738|nr:hypothetical protein [Bacillus toyonensis]PHE64318.1 hypothetical protein COF68_05605 [Bacillus toyonensis]